MTEEIDVADLAAAMADDAPADVQKKPTKKRVRSAKPALPAHRGDRWICGHCAHLCEYGVEDDKLVFCTLRCALSERLAKKKDPASLLAKYQQTAENVLPALPLDQLAEFGGKLSYAEWLQGEFWVSHAASAGVTVDDYKKKRSAPKKAKTVAEKKRSFERGVYAISANKTAAKVTDLPTAYAKLNSYCAKQDKISEFHVVHESTAFGFILRCAPGNDFVPVDAKAQVNKIAASLSQHKDVTGPVIATFLRATSVKEQD